MTPERWQQVKEVFADALERKPSERAAFLQEVCATDESLRSEVESLLRAHDASADFLQELPSRQTAAFDSPMRKPGEPSFICV